MLFLLGLLVGIIGSLSGAGGGFLLMPVFLVFMLLPHPTAAGVSLIAVTVNALIGTVMHWRKRRIELRTGLYMALAAYPGAIFGARMVQWIPEKTFNIVMGIFLTVFSAWMIFTAFKKLQESEITEKDGRFWFTHTHVDKDGTEYKFQYHVPTLIVVSILLGFISSVLGIGGGPLMVPILLYLAHFPYPIVAPTSQFVILLTSVVGALTYVISGNIHWTFAGWISFGVAIGAPIGIWLVPKVGKKAVVLLVAIVLLATGIRLTFFQ